MPTLTLVSNPTTLNPADNAARIGARRKRERFIDNCFSATMLTLLFSAAIYAVSQLFTLAS